MPIRTACTQFDPTQFSDILMTFICLWNTDSISNEVIGVACTPHLNCWETRDAFVLLFMLISISYGDPSKNSWSLITSMFLVQASELLTQWHRPFHGERTDWFLEATNQDLCGYWGWPQLLISLPLIAFGLMFNRNFNCRKLNRALFVSGNAGFQKIEPLGLLVHK